ncbi:MAG: citrate synthase [Clostridiales bacterium]|nr:citrate synthase [Clostridiales bacterium]MBE6046603.1 citrate synthase [Clostridiales bacterium]
MLEKLRVRRDVVKNKVNKNDKKQKEPRDWSVGKHKGSTDSFYENGEAKLKARDRISEELYIENDVKRGLRNSNGTGVVVGLTHIGEVIGYEKDEQGKKVPLEGKLYYRGYDIEDLVNNVLLENRFGFEEISYLLMLGELPAKKDLKLFNDILGDHRELPMGFARDMILTAPSNNVMNKLARSVLALYSFDDNPDDVSLQNVLRQSMSLMGYFPAIICYAYQAKSSYYDKKSLHLHDPIRELSTSENILRMLRPMGEYSDLEAKILDVCMILHAEHGGGNNSSFTTHLISSTGTDTYSAIAAAVGSLKGPKHGGANIAVINMINDIKAHVRDINKRPALDDYLVKILKGEANDRSGLVYGMGHAIYTKSDPRAKILKGMAKKLAESNDRIDDFMLCDYIERRTPQLFAEVHGKEILMPANVDLYSGFVYSALDISTDVATPLFATARLAGWSAHRLEEIVNGGKLMRPAYNSVQEKRDYVAMEDRK